MNWGGFAAGMEGLAQTTIGSLASFGVIGSGSTPTTHVTTQVPSATASAGASSFFGSGFSWLMIAGLLILAFVAFRAFSKK